MCLSNMAAVAAGQLPLSGGGGSSNGETRGGPKRQWLTRAQSDLLEDLYQKWNGDWRGHEAELEEVSTKLELKVRDGLSLLV